MSAFWVLVISINVFLFQRKLIKAISIYLVLLLFSVIYRLSEILWKKVNFLWYRTFLFEWKEKSLINVKSFQNLLYLLYFLAPLPLKYRTGTKTLYEKCHGTWWWKTFIILLSLYCHLLDCFSISISSPGFSRGCLWLETLFIFPRYLIKKSS